MRDLQQASPLAGAQLLGAGASQLHFPCGCRAELTGLSRVARDEPSGSASGKEGGLVISIRDEEEEQAFSVRVRKKVSGVFCTNYSLFPKNSSLLLRYCIGAGAMHAGCMCLPATACAWFVTRPI